MAAFTLTDLDDVYTVIRAKIAQTSIKSGSISDKNMVFDTMPMDDLIKMRNLIEYELGVAAGTYSPRTYAKQGGRCT
jgi:hypothetical protein